MMIYEQEFRKNQVDGAVLCRFRIQVKTMDFVSKMMDFVLEMMDFVSKMKDFI